MGLFCVNMHFQTTDDNALSAALNRRGVSRYEILPAKGGWTSLYEERASEQDDERIRDLAGGLSEDLDVAAISFLVHDSDVACYWLFDKGRLLDQYNSCPDYFDDDAADDEPSGPAGGQPDVLLPYCQADVQHDELAAVLATEALFADRVIERLADALGIDVGRALADYRDVGGGGPNRPGGSADGGDGGQGGGPNVWPSRSGMASGLAEMLGADLVGTNADPQVTALVQAAAGGDTDEVDRLLAHGVAIDSEAPAPLPGVQPMAGLGQLFPHGVPKIAMTPLLAAVANKHLRTAERLLDAGADPNHAHPLFGTPVHAATGAGDGELLQLLLNRGGDPGARNAQGQTPLDLLEASRATMERLAQAQSLMESMGMEVPGVTDPLPVEKLLSDLMLPKEGWVACERMLKAHGAS